jgi:hypothetical protein
MINADMKTYDYYTYSGNNAYGQPTLNETVQGTVTMAINTTSQSVQDNIKYQNATYIGLTLNSNINDTYVIKYGEKKLKVLYVQPKGIYKQVFMSEI